LPNTKMERLLMPVFWIPCRFSQQFMACANNLLHVLIQFHRHHA
jgi:hypothetical protein